MNYVAFTKRLKAKDPEAMRMQAVMVAAGVSVCTYMKAPEDLKPGETFATHAIQSCMREYGPEITTTALRCIREHGNPAELRADVVMSVAGLLRMFPGWMADKSALIGAFKDISWPEVRAAAQRHQKGPGLWRIMLTLLAHDLSQILGAGRHNSNVSSKARVK